MALLRRHVVLSTATGLVAWVLSVLWLPALRLTPYAFVVGVAVGLTLAVCALFIGAFPPRDPPLRNFESPNSFALSSSASWNAETSALKERRVFVKPHPTCIPQELNGSVDPLLDLALRDFIESWWGKISTGQAFPNQVDRTVRVALDNLAGRLQSLDLVQVMVSRLLPIIDNHVQKFTEAEKAVRGKDVNRDTDDVTEELDIAIAAKFDNGGLHPAASVTGSNSSVLQQQHLRNLVEKVLPQVLPGNLLSSSSVSTIIRELVACAILLPAMQLFTDPDFLNQHIEGYGRAVLHERKTVKRLRAALDEAATVKSHEAAHKFPHLSHNDSERLFEQFIRAIRHCNVLHEARNIQNDISGQIENERSLTNQDMTYLRRLEIGKRLLDQRIEQLSTEAAKATSSQKLKGMSDARKTTVSLRDILYNANGLSYFMEYMDQLDKTIFVQFWIVVDGLRNPSERIFDDNIEDQYSWGEAEMHIINKINNNYLWRPEIRVPPGSLAAVNDFLDAGDKATLRQYNTARRAILAAQGEVFRQIETTYFPDFKRSDLYEDTGFRTADTAIRPHSPVFLSVRNESALSQSTTGEPKNQTNPSTASFLKSPDLRRAIASSSDLHSDSRTIESAVTGRRSLDDNSQRLTPRQYMFSESGDEDMDPLSKSLESFESGIDDPLDFPVGRRPPALSAVEATLEDLVDNNDEKDSLFEKRSVTSSQDLGSERGSMDIKRPAVTMSRPTLSSLGLLGTPSKRTVFNSDDLFGENEQLWEDENNEVHADRDGQGKEDDEIKKAAPGDLGLAELVRSLSIEITKLEAQQNVVHSLFSKAELTNNVAELRILKKSEASLSGEIRRKEMQRQQYIIQESDNALYGKASITIKNVMVGTESDGHEFAMYVIEISRTEQGNEASSAVWAIARRFSEFHDLHRRLRRKFGSVRDIEFPRRQMVLTLQKDFLKKRRLSLERYVQELLKYPEICRSFELRAFLSQQSIQPLRPGAAGERIDRKDLVTRIYNSVSDGMEEFLGNVPIIDQLSAAGQNLITAATTVSLPPLSPKAEGTADVDPNTFIPASFVSDPASAAEARQELSALEALENAEQPGITFSRQGTTFIAPIASAFLTLFQLRTSTASSWLRGRAVIIVLQQLLGGTVERRVRDAFTAMTLPSQLSRHLDQIKEAVWPGGGSMVTKAVRTRKDKEKSSSEASVVLAAVLIDVAGGVIGRGVAREAGKRVARMIGNERILKGLGYRILDEFVEAVWEVKVRV